ncbi:hypothetical protein E1B28_013517 [Marasmius oreades]|uniref:Uncharacterized protein n=1 Tax=Marasmius oreades TaxID=181124 RepID=A0A9P7RQC6_9AGAR|nr:uncharacterized protein E1B28_013517 [Marasmius oreades]KAG7087562.1 hypothetical protein E1B28_013517 [Marasmius oreades]
MTVNSVLASRILELIPLYSPLPRFRVLAGMTSMEPLVFACGQHDVGQIGLPGDDPLFIAHPGSIPFPVQVPLPDPDDPVVRISTSSRGNWVVTADGAPYGWGEANSSELGLGWTDKKKEVSMARTPQVIVRRDGGWRAKEIACGGQHSVCLLRRRA